MTLSVFFDTEFTTLNVNGYPALISIGLVAEDGREFYAELSTGWEEGMCSSFVIETVLPMLEGGEFSMTETELGARLKYWVESLGADEVVLWSDAPGMDWPWVAEIFSRYGWPGNLLGKCRGVYFEIEAEQLRFQEALEKFWKKNGERQHHALNDARGLLFAYRHAKGIAPPREEFGIRKDDDHVA